MSETSSQKHEIPKIQSYRELLKVRSSQVLGLNSNKSTLGLAGQNIIKESDRNIPLSKTSKASLVTSLNFDFGTLGEFLNYDMQLKKPDQLFRMNAGGKRNDNKNANQEDWKERLMAKDKQEVETRDPKTIMLQEQDMKKVAKAIRQFIKDMELEIFKEDIDAIEERLIKKPKNKLQELISAIEDMETVKKITEKYAHRPFAERLEVLEKKLEIKHEKHRETLIKQSSNIEGLDRKKKRINAQRSSMQQESDNHAQQPRPSSRNSDGSKAYHTQDSNVKKLSKLGRQEEDRPPKSHMFVENIRTHTMNSSLSPKPKQSIIDDKVVYVNKIISISPYLSKFYQDYIEDRDRYAKQFDKAVEYGSSDFYDVFQTHTKEDIFYLNEKIVLMANMKHNPYLLLHVCVSEFSFKNLISLNLFGSDLPDYILHLTLTLILRYQPPLEMIDFGGNSISPKCADLISQIISLNNLRILRLAEAGLDTKILSQICIGLAKSGIFEELDLSQNKIDDFGLKSLILVLKHSKTLKYIDLRSNNFSDPVLQELDRTLRTNKIMAEKTIKIF